MNDNNTPILSVIVPVYGVEQYIEQCITSLLIQTYSNLEIILVDDGSKGKEGEICDLFAQKDSRIKVIHKENAGLVAARKSGIKAATADYVTFVDGDDFVAKDYYKEIMNWVIKERPDLVAVGFTRYRSEEDSSVYVQSMDSGIYEGERLDYLKNNTNCKDACYYDYSIFPSTWSKVYKRKNLIRNAMTVPEKIRVGEDSAFSFPYILSSEKVIVDNSITGYYYREVLGSMSRKPDMGLFSDAGMLYKYLKPFYSATNKREVMEQLELYRISLLENAICKLTDSVMFSEIHKRCRMIKQLVEESEAFDGVEDYIGNLKIPKRLKEQIELVATQKWFVFELKWRLHVIKRAIKNTIRKE